MKSSRIIYRKLAARMALLDLKKTEMAQLLGMSYSSLHNKMCGVTEFTLDEALQIRRLLCLSCPLEEAFEKYEGA